jgi:hypothetical protein
VFFAETALFEAAERQFVKNNLRRVNPGVPRFDAFRGFVGAFEIARPN